MKSPSCQEVRLVTHSNQVLFRQLETRYAQQALATGYSDGFCWLNLRLPSTQYALQRIVVHWWVAAVVDLPAVVAIVLQGPRHKQQATDKSLPWFALHPDGRW